MYLISDGGLICNTPDTIEAIMLTKNTNLVDGVKLDVRKSFDNVYVLSKYDDLNILTFSKNKVSNSNYNYLRKVKFPSHIFKYYIPTLEEVLEKYDKKKIIVLELYENDLKDLFSILNKYHYKYYFISKNSYVINELKELEFNKLGTIIDDYREIIHSIINHDLHANTFLIKK